MSPSATVPRDRFASLLGDPAVAGSFSARRTARPDDLRLEVGGIGPIALPVSVWQARQLCLVGRPARFGKGERTLLDAKVRDTWEIPKSRVKIDKRQWNATLRRILDRLRCDLGLPDGCQLEAVFHSMLVYAPGQFFAPHQDSEKDDAMIATLVVTLPSASTGGVLVVEHGGQSATYRSSKESLTFVAFYADCRHHVRPVTSGYRVALTYNLLLEGDTVAAAAGRADPGLTAELASCLDEHFGDSAEPTRLVYLLDHEYTQHGLSWARLKGDDASRAAMVRAAAHATDCEVALALAEIQETWSAYEAGSWERQGWRGRHWDDEEEEDDEDGDGDSSDDYELEELIESGTSLDWWLDESGEATPTSLTVDDEEVCASTPTANLSPHESSYEGYMGNYGNTLDRWYRRAAVVVWPRRWAFAVRAEASPEWALDRLADLVRAGDVAGAREAADTLDSFWSVAEKANPGHLLGKALTVAQGLDEPDTATMLLAPFQIEMLERIHAPALAQLAAHYGESWTRDLVGVWFGRDRPAYTSWQPQRGSWLESLPTVCEALRATPEADVPVGRLLTAAAWPPLRESAGGTLRSSTPSYRDAALGELGPAVAGLLVSTAIVRATDLRAQVLAFLCQDNDEMVVCALSALRAAHEAKRQAHPESGLDVIARHCATRLEARLARPARAADDWSIELPDGCRCELCQTLGAFLGDPARRTFEWPLAEQRRRHVHGRIDQGELPVRHQTRRSGRPYTLELSKTDAVFVREREARQRDEIDLAWLRRTPS